MSPKPILGPILDLGALRRLQQKAQTTLDAALADVPLSDRGGASGRQRRQAAQDAAADLEAAQRDSFADLLIIAEERDQLRSAIIDFIDTEEYCLEVHQPFELARLKPESFDLVLQINHLRPLLP